MGERRASIIGVSSSFAAALGLAMIGSSGNAANALTCDRSDIIETVKYLATKYIRSNKDYVYEFVKWPDGKEFRVGGGGIFDPEPVYELSAFRDRGTFGQSGKSCAISAKVTLKANLRLDLTGEYTVEPTTDGKTVVTARFSPN